MTDHHGRLHLEVTGDSPRELGRSRGRALRGTLGEAYTRYAELFRLLGVGEEVERDGVERVLAAVEGWRPALVEQLAGVAEGAGIPLEQVVALNARTELIALGPRASSECSTVTAVVDGRRTGVQTWDWHVELDRFWHTHTVTGHGLRHAGLTEQGILSKIGVNEAGLALHFNILGHAADGPDGVPMHLLSSTVLSECRTVDEAVALLREAPIASSSAFTMLDVERAVSVEMSPVGVFEITETDGSVQRTNHFQDAQPLAGQKHEVYEPDSSERLALIRERLAQTAPQDPAALVRLLLSGAGEPPLTCVADMSKTYGERWATLATIVTEPGARTIRILNGMPTEAETGAWRTLSV
ncbi:C45 family peptidase [Leucobacter allii]|uniref:C45 family peptidase n=1 Tax=Leucobacter allii TaxID=2932247 RepID=A0ABY4FK28_9MICO|nr:C45 family peptidase [Leucobacter allii]UOQ56562.1 C45 family peptidase [Leucobacter allii]